MKKIILDTTVCPKCEKNKVREPKPGKTHMWLEESAFKLACGYCGHERVNPNPVDLGYMF